MPSRPRIIMPASAFDLHELGDFRLESGQVLASARLAYRAFGTLSPSRDNVILFPGAFNAPIADPAAWIGPGRALDPTRHFIVATGLFGNGQSSSPSNTPAPLSGPDFPAVTIGDNVAAQHHLLTRRFGVEHLQLIPGFSMGALQAYHWAAHHPEMVERIAPFCGAARCSRHNYLMLAGLRATIEADATFDGGRYASPPIAGLTAFGRVFGAWVFSQAFHREELDRTVLGHASMDDYIARFFDASYLQSDANDLLAMIDTWQQADIAKGERYRGDFGKALSAIRARALVMPCETDLYFTVDDSRIEVAGMPNARLRPIPSNWGHLAGIEGLNPADTAFIEAGFRELLES